MNKTTLPQAPEADILCKQVLPSNHYDHIRSLRRKLHRHPELAWKETDTITTVKEELVELGITWREAASTGLIADIPGKNPKFTIALRADLDALPIHEETGLPFTSENPGRMHACGHDGHTAMLLGAARLLKEEPVLPCNVRLLFQPAEELGEGAKEMIAASALEDVTMAFGGHLDPHFPCGVIAVTDGVVNAASDRFRIDISGGTGGHAARPHEAIDCVVIGSLMVMAMQTIVSREVNPSHPTVITVGHFASGKAANAIAHHALLEGTIRTLDYSTRNLMTNAITRIANNIGAVHGAKVKVSIKRGTPALNNAPEAAELSRDAARLVVGEGQVWAMDMPSMGSEDFSYYAERIPCNYVRFGAKSGHKTSFPLHSNQFNFDEHALATGAAYYCEIAKHAGNLAVLNAAS